MCIKRIYPLLYVRVYCIYCTLFFTTQTSSFRRPKAFLTVLVHCKKNNLNLCIKSDLITAGADAAVFCPAFVYICLAQKPDMRGTVYHCICSIDMLRRFRLFLGQCTSVADPDVWNPFHFPGYGSGSVSKICWIQQKP